MKNLLKLIGIIAITTVIGFSMTACSEESTAAEGITTGKLVLVGFDFADNGKYISANGIIPEDTAADPVTPPVYIFAAEKYDSKKDEITFGVIKNNVSTTSVWQLGGGGVSGYLGDTELDKLTIYLYASATSDVPESYLEIESVTFTSGVAVVDLTEETFTSLP